jgi:transcriptional regulator with XRE-family HTH domain
MDHEKSALEESTGHSRHLREVLRAAREREGLTQQQVAEKITARMRLEKQLSSSSVSEWERFNRHPAIDIMAAWCRVLGMRLMVDIDGGSSNRVPVLVRPEVADLARKIDMLSDDDRRLLEGFAARMTPIAGRV